MKRSVSQPEAMVPDDVEDPDDGQQARRGGFRHAVVVGGGNEVGADQPVGGGAADGEPGHERPERADLAGALEHLQRPDSRVAAGLAADPWPRSSGGAGAAGAADPGVVDGASAP